MRKSSMFRHLAWILAVLMLLLLITPLSAEAG
jgi:hypothetical protein